MGAPGATPLLPVIKVLPLFLVAVPTACSKSEPAAARPVPRASSAATPAAATRASARESLRPPSGAGERVALSTAVVGDQIYAIAGTTRSDWASDVVDVYDVGEETWSGRKPMTVPRAFPAATSLERKVYVMGGMNHDAAFLADFESYDPAIDAWERLPKLPTPRNRLTAVAFDGRIYAIGGMVGGPKGRPTNTAVLEVFDTAKGRWERRADMPTPRHGHSAVVAFGRIYVFGGYGELEGAQGPLATVEEYDPVTDTWTKKRGGRVRRGFFGAALVHDKIYLFGGRLMEAPTEVYDPGADSWDRASPIPGTRSRFGVGVVGETVYMIGGEDAHGTNGMPLGTYEPLADRWSD